MLREGMKKSGEENVENGATRKEKGRDRGVSVYGPVGVSLVVGNVVTNHLH